MSNALTDLLNAYSSAALTALATYHRVLPKGSKTKEIMVEALAKVLPERERILREWQQLSKPERAAMEVVLQRGGQASVRTLRENLAGRKLIDKNAAVEFYPHSLKKPNPHAENSRRLEDVLARLTLRGLLFAADDPASVGPDPDNQPLRSWERPYTNVFIPDPIKRHLPEPPPPLTATSALLTVSTTRESSARTFQRDLYLYWSYVRTRPFTLIAKDEAPKSDLKVLGNLLLTRETLDKGEGELDHPRLRFLRLMLTALGALREQNTAVTVTGDTRFFALPPAERVKKCYEVWRDGDFFNEIILLPEDVRPQRFDPTQLKAHPTIIAARRKVLEYLSTFTGAWIAFADLITQLRENDYEFLLRRQPTRPGYYYGPRTPYEYSANPLGVSFGFISGDEDGWDKVEANFIRSLLTGPLYWLGLVDLGSQKKSDDSDAFRLTPLGAWVLGRGPQPEISAEGGRVIVQPNLHIIALDPVSDATLVTLDQFAERLTAERAVEYQLTRESVYHGQRSGWDVPRLKAYLREQTGVELPGNVARTLDEWQGQHDRIRIHPSVALGHGSARAFDELSRDPQSAKLIVSRPMAEVVILKDGKALKEIEQILRSQGVIPVVSVASTLSANLVEADDSGAIRFISLHPNLYLHGHLVAFADPAEGGYKLSEETVSRATRSGLSANDIVQRLSAIHRGPVPSGLMRRVRAWAKHYGEAALETVALLQLRDAVVLEELLADPEIAPLLKKFKPNLQRALAQVVSADLDKLRALLTERGIDLSDQLE